MYLISRDGPPFNATKCVRIQYVSDFRYMEYQSAKEQASSGSLQLTLGQFGLSGGNTYGACHPKQKMITEAIISDLVVDCAFPLSLIEKPGFRRFMSKIDAKYKLMGR